MIVRLVLLAATIVALGACDGAGMSSAEPVRLAPFACGNLSVPIHSLQGDGAMSPRVGHVVDVEGIVTGNFLTGLSGFFIEAPAGARDVEASTSEGAFVLLGRRDDTLRRGQLVRVRASVAEAGDEAGLASLTTLTAVSELAICADDQPLPDPVALVPPIDDWEHYEGMRVLLDAPVTITGNHELLRFGRVDASLDGRLFQPSERALPGAAAEALDAANRRARIVLDDNLEVQNPRRVWWTDPAVRAATPWRVGTVLDGVAGIVDTREGELRLQLTDAPRTVTQAPRPEAPPEVGGDLRIVSFNLENFFNGDGRGRGFPTPRGAASREAFVTQRKKLIATLEALAPDVAVLQELENDGYGKDSAIDDLVGALNRAVDGGGDYAFVRAPTDGLGKDQIKVGVIYREGRVRSIGTPASYEQGAFVDLNRVPLAASFEPVDGGAPFTVVANHFKSKGGCEEASGANKDQGDGQGCWNDARRRAARELAEWLATEPTGAAGDAVLILGDLNAYGMEDPVRWLIENGYADVVARHAGPDAYSFVFDGQSGRLDHALASGALAQRVTGAAEWHINADELDAFGDARDGAPPRIRALIDASPYRSSDHDPLVVGLRRE